MVIGILGGYPLGARCRDQVVIGSDKGQRGKASRKHLLTGGEGSRKLE